MILILLMSCKQKASESGEAIDSLSFKKLETVEERKEFLQEIFDADQAVRKESNNTDLNPSDNAAQMAMFHKMDSIDDLNLHKIRWYLDNYEYPSKDSYGDTLSRTPALVVHHSNNDGIRREFYPQFKKAYEDGSLEASFFALYLGRLYEIENGSYYRMKTSTYMIEDQIDSLIVELDL
ncbi:hypothetical protein [Nonlabens dokdonensis]|uniref:Lipoprotein n=2 Tax=Nonlabens dokdonensis TaxID=328515 RepID=L7W9L2_NONDD|nr:hypothetical protein [Nonlabens dokdonensis]AGC76794.1 hypothetical protein DDD_1667 [Nonlabens dokdonensis DSW-6]